MNPARLRAADRRVHSRAFMRENRRGSARGGGTRIPASTFIGVRTTLRRVCTTRKMENRPVAPAVLFRDPASLRSRTSRALARRSSTAFARGLSAGTGALGPSETCPPLLRSRVNALSSPGYRRRRSNACQVYALVALEAESHRAAVPPEFKLAFRSRVFQPRRRGGDIA